MGRWLLWAGDCDRQGSVIGRGAATYVKYYKVSTVERVHSSIDII